jgi:hypothetical protein
MEGIRAYLLSVTAAALVCAVIRSMTEQAGTGAGLIRLLSGVFLCFTVISPVTQIRLDSWLELPETFLEQGTAAAAEGEDYAKDILRQHIKEQTEAYILDIAQSFEIQIQADVTVSQGDPPVPEAVRLTGNLTAREKQQLSRRIEQELAIAKENQLWMD